MGLIVFLIVVLGGGFVVLGLVEVDPPNEVIEHVIPHERFSQP